MHRSYCNPEEKYKLMKSEADVLENSKTVPDDHVIQIRNQFQQEAANEKEIKNRLDMIKMLMFGLNGGVAMLPPG